MKLYSAYIKKNQEDKLEDVILLKEGFSWMAFFFSIFWFLYHKMFKEFFAVIIIGVTFALLEHVGVLYGFGKISADILLTFFIALNANYWLADSLKNKGYEFSGVLFGHNEFDAKRRFLENCNNVELDDSIIDPKQYRKKIKEQAREKSKLSHINFLKIWKPS